MNYGEILRRSLAISWRHKYLWLLALFAGEGMGLGFTDFSRGSGRDGRADGSRFTFDQFSSWVASHSTLLITIGIAVAVLMIVLFLISAAANGAVVKGAAEHDLDHAFGLGESWRSGLTTFWPVLGVKVLGLLVTLGMLAVVASLALGAWLAGTNGNVPLAVLAGVSAGLLALVAIPFWIVFAVVIRLAVRAVVLDAKRPLAAISHGFGLVRRRFGRLALVWLLVLVSGALAGLGVTIAVVIVGLPLAAITAATYAAGGISVAIWVGVVLAIVLAAIAITLTAAVEAFTSVIWTLAYARLDIDPQPVPAGVPAPA
jgi:hypothetical protein